MAARPAASAVGSPLRTLPGAARARLERSLTRAVRAARSRGEVLAWVSLPLAPTVDPAAVACASRRPGEPWFLFENPDRERAALAALGCVRALEAGGADRFARVAAEWRRLAGGAVGDDGLP